MLEADSLVTQVFQYGHGGENSAEVVIGSRDHILKIAEKERCQVKRDPCKLNKPQDLGCSCRCSYCSPCSDDIGINDEF